MLNNKRYILISLLYFSLLADGKIKQLNKDRQNKCKMNGAFPRDVSYLQETINPLNQDIKPLGGAVCPTG